MHGRRERRSQASRQAKQAEKKEKMSPNLGVYGEAKRPESVAPPILSAYQPRQHKNRASCSDSTPQTPLRSLS